MKPVVIVVVRFACLFLALGVVVYAVGDPPVGDFPNYRLSQRAFSSASGYFSKSTQRKARDYFVQWQKKLAVDPSGVTRQGPVEEVDYPIGSQSALVVVPASYTADGTWGIYLHLSPMDEAWLSDGWRGVLEARRLIFVSPRDGGNNHGEWLRTAQALDALVTVAHDYPIDGKRVVIGGFSGGGYMSFWIQMLYPEVFAGAINQGRDFPLKRRRTGLGVYPAAMPYLQDSDFSSIAYRPNKWVFVMGDKDQNFQYLQDCQSEFERHRFRKKVMVVLGMDHRPAPAKELAAALDWILEGGVSSTDS